MKRKSQYTLPSKEELGQMGIDISDDIPTDTKQLFEQSVQGPVIDFEERMAQALINDYAGKSKLQIIWLKFKDEIFFFKTGWLEQLARNAGDVPEERNTSIAIGKQLIYLIIISSLMLRECS